MADKLKALKTFMQVRAGQEFDESNPSRANELVTKGYAVRVGAGGGEPPKSRRAPNKAAGAGPLSSTGGRAAAGKRASSSRPARAPRAKKPSSKK